eukprot:1348486-Pyramimonas_sp.AAC.2
MSYLITCEAIVLDRCICQYSPKPWPLRSPCRTAPRCERRCTVRQPRGWKQTQWAQRACR